MWFPNNKSIHSCFHSINNECPLDARGIVPPTIQQWTQQTYRQAPNLMEFAFLRVGEKDNNQTPSNIYYSVVVGMKKNMVRKEAEGCQE